jgi:hypothetical protein
MQARHLACIHASDLHLVLKGECVFLADLSRNLPPPAMITLINCITKPLMGLGINGFHDLTSANEGHIIPGKQLRNKYSRI